MHSAVLSGCKFSRFTHAYQDGFSVVKGSQSLMSLKHTLKRHLVYCWILDCSEGHCVALDLVCLHNIIILS